MPEPPLDPPVADAAPHADVLTPYDEGHLSTYLRPRRRGRRSGLDGGGASRPPYRSVPRPRPRAPRVGKPSGPRQMDDGAWLPVPPTWRRPRLISRDCWSTFLRTDAVVVVKVLTIQRIAWPPCSALLTSIADRSPYLRNAIVTVSIGLAKSFHAPPT